MEPKKKLVLAQKPLQLVGPLSSKGHLGVKDGAKEGGETGEKGRRLRKQEER